MERISRTKHYILWMITAFAAAWILPASVSGDTIMAPAPIQENLGPKENFAESRFGKDPAIPDIGFSTAIREGFVSQAVKDIDADRRPAGMEFTTTTTTTTNSTPPNTGMGTEPKPTPQQVEAAREMLSQDGPTERTQAAIQKGVQEVAVIASDHGYFPKTIFVSRDVPVRIFVTGASRNTLCFMMDSFQVRRQIRAQKIEEITFTASVPGKYRFYCPVNGMEGTIVVKELTSQIALAN
jgi:plastocyanin